MPTDYELPDGFLKGYEAQLQWRTNIPIIGSLNDNDWKTLSYFKWRAAEFLNNIKDLDLPNKQNASTNRTTTQKVKGTFKSNIWPGKYRAKSIFLDFRPMCTKNGEDSYSSFGRTKNLIAKNSNDKLLNEFVTRINNDFLSNHLEISFDQSLPKELRNQSVRDLLKLWFNTHGKRIK